MNKNNKIIINFKNTPEINKDKPSIETVKNSTRDLNKIFSKLKSIQNKIKSCNSIEDLNKNVNLSNISNDLGMIVQSSIIFDDTSFKKNIEEANRLYRETEVLYFDKKIELLNKKINIYDKTIKETFQKSENSLKEITGGTLFSIASVFLGISLTSSLVSGVQYVESNFLLLYFITCLLIAIVTIGLSAIFMRKVDTKAKVIICVIVIVSIIWGMIAFFSYNNIDNKKSINDITNNSNINEEEKIEEGKSEITNNK